MGSGFASWCISCCVLLALMVVEVSNARKITRRHHIEQGSIGSNYLQQPSSTVHGDHIDPSGKIFFKMEDLKVGKTMAIYFTSKDLSASPRLLSRKEADSIPFSSTKLPQIIDLFEFSKDSHQAKAVEYTIKQCELEPLKGELRFCATSLESMLDYARTLFGSNTNIKVLTTTLLQKPAVPLQNYTISNIPERIPSSRMIACHTLPYPYAVFYCHTQKSETRLFRVSLGSETGDKVQAIAACHMDTSQWDLNHVSFRLLKIERGSCPVCHFFPPDNLVWVSLSA
ncbi:unknown seed protein like 1 [Hibiscus trionum]|uniref:BURP domain-containing protein n=1 Tax=Hibiscus trionum TaxID=183268 RepID=A0A9W7MPB2_HIBTR|nr:unknown seed protein like 1 [Hibiscus trionum]